MGFKRFVHTCGYRGYEIRCRRVFGGFSYRPMSRQGGAWKYGKRRVFQTFTAAKNAGAAYMG